MKLNQLKPFNKWLFISLAIVYTLIFVILKLNLIDIIKVTMSTYSTIAAISITSIYKACCHWFATLSYIVWYFIVWATYVIITIARYYIKNKRNNK